MNGVRREDREGIWKHLRTRRFPCQVSPDGFDCKEAFSMTADLADFMADAHGTVRWALAGLKAMKESESALEEIEHAARICRGTLGICKGAKSWGALATALRAIIKDLSAVTGRRVVVSHRIAASSQSVQQRRELYDILMSYQKALAELANNTTLSFRTWEDVMRRLKKIRDLQHAFKDQIAAYGPDAFPPNDAIQLRSSVDRKLSRVGPAEGFTGIAQAVRKTVIDLVTVAGLQ